MLAGDKSLELRGVEREREMTGECQEKVSRRASQPRRASGAPQKNQNETHQINRRRRSNEAEATCSRSGLGAARGHLGNKSHLDGRNTLLTLVIITSLLLRLPAPSNQVPSTITPTAAGSQAPDNKQQLLASGRQQTLLRRQLERARALEELEQISPLPLSSLLSPASAGSPASQHQHAEAPRMIPLSALERYQEGAELKLFCSASAPPTGGRLLFDWRRSQPAEVGGLFAGEQQLSARTLLANGKNVHISMMDDSSSLLRISQLEAEDSGNYTCLARNQHGFDSSTVRVNVNVRLKWLKEPPSELQVKAGKSVQLECDASGQPAPLISWTSLRDRQTINSKLLRFERTQVNDSGLYECLASSAVGLPASRGAYQAAEAVGDNFLRKLVRLVVKGK